MFIILERLAGNLVDSSGLVSNVRKLGTWSRM